MVVVELGPDQDMDAKILVLSDILPEIRERGSAAPLDLSTYSETDRDGRRKFQTEIKEFIKFRA